MSNYITTYSKLKFNPLNPKIDDISIADIAHALSLMCRANGHFPEFYSVAQHSIYCSQEAIERGYSTKVALACLLHDASEAYLADITRPIKPSLANYLDIEKNLQSSIYKKYLKEDLTAIEIDMVSSVDDAVLYHEFIYYMKEELHIEDTKLCSSPVFQFEEFSIVENKYIELFNSLISSLI